MTGISEALLIWQRRLLSNRTSGVLCWNEFQVEGVGLVWEVFEAVRGAGGGDHEGFGFIIRLPAHDQRPDDVRQVGSLAVARSALRASRPRRIPFAGRPLKCAPRPRCPRPCPGAL